MDKSSSRLVFNNQLSRTNKQTNNMPWFLVFAGFCGVKIPTVAEFKLPIRQWS